MGRKERRRDKKERMEGNKVGRNEGRMGVKKNRRKDAK